MVQIPPAASVPAPRFADPYLAAIVQGESGQPGTIGTPFWDLAAWDLRDGHEVHLDRLGTGAFGGASFVLAADGAIAWIYGPAGGPVTVGADDANGYRQLDAGAAIDVSSLRLAGDVVSWSDGGVTRSATLA